MCAVVSVGAWNLENLFRPGSRFGPKTQQAYDDKLEALKAVIDELAPDVLAVQEVGEPAALDELVATLDGQWHTALSMVFVQSATPMPTARA
jgi:hypothetical protein